jgi:hypothetical protein
LPETSDPLADQESVRIHTSTRAEERADVLVSSPKCRLTLAAASFFAMVRARGDGVPQYRREADDSCHAEERAGFVLCQTTNAVFFAGLPPKLFGLSHGIINQGQYSALAATAIANASYLPVTCCPRESRKLRRNRRGRSRRRRSRRKSIESGTHLDVAP